VRVGVEVVDAARVERRGPAFDAVDIVALAQKKLSQAGSVLAGDAGNQCSYQFIAPLIAPPLELHIATNHNYIILFDYR
jgi:hypothetical protein